MRLNSVKQGLYFKYNDKVYTHDLLGRSGGRQIAVREVETGKPAKLPALTEVEVVHKLDSRWEVVGEAIKVLENGFAERKQKLSDILNSKEGGVTDLVWGPDLEFVKENELDSKEPSADNVDDGDDVTKGFSDFLEK